MNYMSSDTFNLSHAETLLAAQIGAVQYLVLLRRLPADFFDWEMKERERVVEAMLRLANRGFHDLDVLLACVETPFI